jgi:hypothetical protein
MVFCAVFSVHGLTNDRHSFAYVVEIKDGQQGIGDWSAQLGDRDGAGGPGAEHKAKVPCGRDQGAFVWRLGLVQQLPWTQEGRDTTD